MAVIVFAERSQLTTKLSCVTPRATQKRRQQTKKGVYPIFNVRMKFLAALLICIASTGQSHTVNPAAHSHPKQTHAVCSNQPRTDLCSRCFSDYPTTSSEAFTIDQNQPVSLDNNVPVGSPPCYFDVLYTVSSPFTAGCIQRMCCGRPFAAKKYGAHLTFSFFLPPPFLFANMRSCRCWQRVGLFEPR